MIVHLLVGIDLEILERMGDVNLTVPIRGMSCQHCVRRIEQGLAVMPGILSAKADLLRKVAEIVFDDRQTSERDVKARIRELGFEVA